MKIDLAANFLQNCRE